MSTQLEFYLERAARARADAEAATLENVRRQCLRSADAWNEMVARLERVELLRFENDAAKVLQPLVLE
jgi:outer membrane protein TolC